MKFSSLQKFVEQVWVSGKLAHWLLYIT